MSHWVEIRAAVRRTGVPRLVPLAEVDQHTGFRSTFAYDADTAQRIRDQGSTGGLRHCPVYADTLFMDFDGHQPDEFREWLAGSGLAYEEYDSGNRSVHFHIPLLPVFGPWVPRACKLWVKRRAPTADVSFYHPAGMYRLPGTYHPKQPGRCKMLVGHKSGDILALTQPAAETYTPRHADETTPERFFTTLMQAVGEGQRRPRAWLLATMAAECGLEFNEAVDHLLWWNSRLVLPPHAEDTIVQQVTSAYRRLARCAAARG